MRLNTSFILTAASILLDAALVTGEKIPTGAAEGNYILMRTKSKIQDTIYPYVDGGARCILLDPYQSYAGDYEMYGSIMCKWWKDNDCGNGISTMWVQPGSKGKLEFKAKAFACRLPLVGFAVTPVPSEHASQYYSESYNM